LSFSHAVPDKSGLVSTNDILLLRLQLALQIIELKHSLLT